MLDIKKKYNSIKSKIFLKKKPKNSVHGFNLGIQTFPTIRALNFEVDGNNV